MKKAFPNIDEMVRTGDFIPLRDWLRKNVHLKGSLLTGEELLESATGEKLNMEYYFSYVSEKYGELYPRSVA